MSPQLLEWASAHRLVVGVIVGAVAIAQVVAFQVISTCAENFVNQLMQNNANNQSEKSRTD